MFQNDFLMRQIQMLVQFIAKVVFNKDAIVYDVVIDSSGNVTGEGELYLKLRSMLSKGKINEAENLLFERIDENSSQELLQIALDFYSQLEEFSDEYLEECGFSREEVLEGLIQIEKKYGITEALPR